MGDFSEPVTYDRAHWWNNRLRRTTWNIYMYLLHKKEKDNKKKNK